MPRKRKLTYFDKVEIKRRKKEHADLIAIGNYAAARRCGPKVIAGVFGVDKSLVHRTCTSTDTALFPCIDWMG